MSANHVPFRSAVVAVALAVGSVGLAACASSTPAATTNTTTPAAATAAAGKLTLTDGWVRSKEVLPSTATGMASDMSMTGVFGTLTNTTDQQITITGGSSPAAGLVELHETVPGSDGAMVMRPKSGGFVIPAKGTFVLKPGGNHIMLMKMSAMPKIGTTVDVTLQTSAGEVKLSSIAVRNFAGGDEKYVPGTTMPSSAHH